MKTRKKTTKSKQPTALAKYWKAKRACKSTKKTLLRAKKSKTKRRAVRSTNPRPMLYIITAKGSGKKMHYDGSKFSERERVQTYATVEAAQRAALNLLSSYPVLKKYRIAIEHNLHLPPKG